MLGTVAFYMYVKYLRMNTYISVLFTLQPFSPTYPPPLYDVKSFQIVIMICFVKVNVLFPSRPDSQLTVFMEVGDGVRESCHDDLAFLLTDPFPGLHCIS